MYHAVAYMETRNGVEIEIGFEFYDFNVDGDHEILFGFKDVDEIEIDSVKMLFNCNRERKLDYNKMSDKNKKRVLEAIIEWGESNELDNTLRKYNEPPSHLVDMVDERRRLMKRGF